MHVIGNKKYVTPQEAANLLAIHLTTVYSWCSKGQVELLDAVQIGEASASKYWIELESLRRRHAHVYLESR